MRLLIFVTLDGKTYTNDFPFSNGFPYTSRLCQPFERPRLGHAFTRNSTFEWLPHRPHPLVRNINPFERLNYAFVRNIKPFKRLGHPFVEDSRRFERLGHLYYGIPLNFLSNDMHGRRVTLFVPKKITRSSGHLTQCFQDLFDFICTSLSALSSYFALFKTTRVHKRRSWSGFFLRCSRL